MRMGQGVRTGLGHEGITCVLQTQFSSCNLEFKDGRRLPLLKIAKKMKMTISQCPLYGF